MKKGINNLYDITITHQKQMLAGAGQALPQMIGQTRDKNYTALGDKQLNEWTDFINKTFTSIKSLEYSKQLFNELFK